MKPEASSGLIIRRVPISELHADPANVNTHDESNLRQIRGSLQEFGQVEPLVVQAGTGKVIGGNGRLDVMRELGFAECDIVEFDGGDVRATALAIALNRSAKTSAFDDDALIRTLRALQDEDFDLGAVGFTDAEVDALFGTEGGEVVEDPQAEWQGMPEFEHEDLTAVQILHVHFKSRDDVLAFAELVGQQVTDKTKSLWYPQQEIIRYGTAE